MASKKKNQKAPRRAKCARGTKRSVAFPLLSEGAADALRSVNSGKTGLAKSLLGKRVLVKSCETKQGKVRLLAARIVGAVPKGTSAPTRRGGFRAESRPFVPRPRVDLPFIDQDDLPAPREYTPASYY